MINPEPRLQHFGNEKVPVVTIDGLAAIADRASACAASLEPFPPPGNNYPGKRRVIEERDEAAFTDVVSLLEVAKPYLAGAFNLDGFELVEASYSIVTTPPADLSPMQRTPHFDTLDSNFFAVLFYLSPCAGTGFYRHRETGIELLSEGNIQRYAASVTQQVQPPGYIFGDNRDYELTGLIQGEKGRLVAYPGASLHAGQIPPDLQLHGSVAMGRLTANIFLRGW